MERKSYKDLLFISTNERNNKVNVYGVDNEGITFLNSYNTRGSGTENLGIDPLKSQGSICVSRDNKYIYVVNAKSNDLSVFRLNIDYTLKFIQKISTSGIRPVSITCSERNVYVLNSGDKDKEGNITSFMSNRDGTLSIMENRVVPIGRKGQNSTSIIVNKKGDKLIVSETDNNMISVHSVDRRGNIIEQVANRSNGKKPYGICAMDRDFILVVENGYNTVSTYEVRSIGTITFIDDTMNDNAKVNTNNNLGDLTKMVITGDEEFAYGLDSTMGSIIQYIVYENGEIDYWKSYGTENKFSKLSEITIDKNDNKLFVLDNRNCSILCYKILKHGVLSLDFVEENTYLKSNGSVGLAILKILP